MGSAEPSNNDITKNESLPSTNFMAGVVAFSGVLVSKSLLQLRVNLALFYSEETKVPGGDMTS